MRKNTRVAIQKRLDQGLTDFAIGEKRYWLKQSCLLSRYRDDIGDLCGSYGPMIEGVVVDGVFDPDNIFTPEEKAALAASRDH